MFNHQFNHELHDFFFKTLGIYCIQDYFEIFFFIGLFFIALRWLQQDYTQHLVLYIYYYCGLLCITSKTSCFVVFHTLLIGAPLFILFLIMIHQKTLQKTFVLSQKPTIHAQKITDPRWLEILVQSMIQASHQHKNIVCVIERSKSLSSLFQHIPSMHISIDEYMTQLIFHSSKLTDYTIVWIHESGIIYGITETWGSTVQEQILQTQHHPEIINHESSLLITTKTDALVFSLNHQSHNHSMWYQGEYIKHLNTQHLITTVRKIIYTQQNMHSAIVSPIMKTRKSYDQRNSTTP